MRIEEEEKRTISSIALSKVQYLNSHTTKPKKPFAISRLVKNTKSIHPNTPNSKRGISEKEKMSSKKRLSSRLSAKIPSRKVPPTPTTQQRNETPAKSSTSSSSEDTRRSRKMTQSLPRRSPPPPPPPAEDTKKQSEVRNEVSNQQIRAPPTRRVVPRESGAACSCVIS